MIGIVDYDMGNLWSVQKALERIGASGVKLVQDADSIARSERLIVPGVGAFGDAMAALRRYGLVEPLRAFAASGRPVMGICLGMQAFFDSSEEAPGVEGLSLIAGTVRRFPSNGLKVPHMGWNTIELRGPSKLLAGAAPSPAVYFVHSYYVEPRDPAAACGVTEYGSPFGSVVERGNVVGTQFHPEKSQETGLAILANFLRMN